MTDEELETRIENDRYAFMKYAESGLTWREFRITHREWLEEYFRKDTP